MLLADDEELMFVEPAADDDEDDDEDEEDDELRDELVSLGRIVEQNFIQRVSWAARTFSTSFTCGNTVFVTRVLFWVPAFATNSLQNESHTCCCSPDKRFRRVITGGMVARKSCIFVCITDAEKAGEACSE